MNFIRSLFNISSIYILLWCLYAFHWNEIMVGSIIDVLSNVFLGVNLLVSCYCFFIVRKRLQNKYLKAMSVMLLLFCIYGFIYILIGSQSAMLAAMGVSPISYIVGPLRSLLPIFAFYYFTQQGFLSDKKIIFWSFIILALYAFFSYTRTAIMMSDATRIGFTNNMGYLFVALIPCVYLLRGRTLYQYLLLGVLLLFIVRAMKRGAILVGLVISFLFIKDKFKSSTSKEKIWVIVCVTAFVGIAAYYVVNTMMNDAYFQYRLAATMEGDSSGRDDIIGDLEFYLLNTANVFQWLFGSGADATVAIAGNYAHNDWWEVLINQGIIGLFFYFWYWIRGFKYSSKCTPMYKGIILSFVLTYFLRCFFSMSYSSIPLASTLLVGYALAKEDELRLQNNI